MPQKVAAPELHRSSIRRILRVRAHGAVRAAGNCQSRERRERDWQKGVILRSALPLRHATVMMMRGEGSVDPVGLLCFHAQREQWGATGTQRIH